MLRPLDRLRSRRSPLYAIRRSWRRSRQSPTAVLIAVACLALALLTILQLQWIVAASDAHRDAALRSLNRSVTLLYNNLRDELLQLLTSFQATVGENPEDRADHYLERYYSWSESSSYGPAIKRILFYDKPISGNGGLTELSTEAQSVERALWGPALDGLRTHLDSVGFRPGRVIIPRWISTWMYYPAYSALVRSFGRVEANSPDGELSPVMAGYLILQLDLEYCSERVFPAMLGQYFAGRGADPTYDFSIAVDGEEVQLYRLSRKAGIEPSAQGAPVDQGAYTLVRAGHLNDEERLRTPDLIRPFLLMTRSMPNPALRRGAVQRVSLRSRVGRVESERAGYRSQPRLEAKGGESGAGLASAMARVLARPRVFVVAEERSRLELFAKHSGGSLEQAMAARFRRSLAIGLFVVLLLAAAIALVAIAARRAARLADMRMEFVAGVSHELRTPLAAILVIGDNIAEGLLGPGKKALEYGELIREHGRRLSEMVENTLQLSAIESGEHRYNLTKIDVSRVAQDALAEAGPLIEQAGFVLERAEAEGLPPVLADERALRQSLGNLLSNAVKYGVPGHWIKLETVASDSARGNEVQIRVHDRGQGIPAAEVSRIFDPFYRAAGSRRASIPGSGLGLKLARDMVHGMGGRLTLQSQPGEGSVFTIHLPATR